jgi:hypothetical protein
MPTTEEQESKLKQAFSIGCTIDEALCYAEMRKREWLEYLAAHPDFLFELEDMRLKPLIKARMSAVQNLDDPKHAQWYLERKKKDEFSLRSELTGKDGKDLFISEERKAEINKAIDNI